MTLSFSRFIDNTPTYFPEKIWSGLRTHPIDKHLVGFMGSEYYSGKEILDMDPKLHSIRADKKGRWKPGMKIHMVINNRTKKRLQFAPVLEVKSVQEFQVVYFSEKNKIRAVVYIDGVLQGEAFWINCQFKFASITLERLAKNDGFDSVNLFFEWFDKDFTGKIIHWTDHKY